MKKLFEFRCSSCNYDFEELTEYVQVIPCPKCNANADKLISTPRVKLEGYSGSFPGAAAAWEKKHKQQLAKELKQNAA
jgi:putative FmdB family regulatory protein